MMHILGQIFETFLRYFPKMSDDLEILKKFLSEFLTAFLAFPKNFFFLSS